MNQRDALRPIAVVTGAAGGIGRGCARLLGHSYDLLLTDRQAVALRDLARQLSDEGYRIRGVHPGDLCDAALLGRLAADVAGERFALVHCAGLSPALAEWRDILTVNLVGTAMLLDVFEKHLRPGCVAILVASAAGYRAPHLPAAEVLLTRPLAPDFLQGIGTIVEREGAAMPGGERGLAYMLSKRAVHLLAECRAVRWGRGGARILSVSPTLTLTAMGRQEIAATPIAQQFVDSAPMGRMAVPGDVAMAIAFLVSDQAAFITGCDLRVDGGAFALTAHGASPD